ncbi:MAG: hypothetical protein ACAI44_13790 [Candidatus Sericytochromatia bacterium]
MFSKLANTFSANSIDFETMRSASQFSRKPTRLRELRGDEAPLAELPPPLAEAESPAVRLEALIEPVPDKTPRADNSPAAAAKPPAPTGADQAALAKAIRMQKSTARSERLKDIRHGLDQISEKLEQAQSGALLKEARQLLLTVARQLTAPYGGATALTEAEGMAVVRPLLLRHTQKLDALRQDQPGWLAKIKEPEARAIARLKEPNPLPALEKAALLALGEALDHALALYFSKSATQTPAQTELSAQAELPEPEASGELDLSRAEAQLFQLRKQLQRSRDEAEKARLEAEIQRWEAALAQQALQQRLQQLQRAARGFDALQGLLQRGLSQLEATEDETACRILYSEALKAKTRINQELRSLVQDLAAPPGEHPLLALLRLQQKRWTLLQMESAPTLLEKLVRDEAQALDALAQNGLEEAEKALARDLNTCLGQMVQAFERFQSLINSRLSATKAANQLGQLEALGSEFEDFDRQIAELESQFWQADPASEQELRNQIFHLHLEKHQKLAAQSNLLKT